MADKSKILIIQTAFLGDTILSLPMVQTLKKINPGFEIDFMCIPATANVLLNNTNICKVIKYDKKASGKLDKLIQIIKIIRSEKYDVILCPHRSFRSALMTYFSKADVRIGFNKNALSFLLTHKAVYRPDFHEINRNLELIKLIPGITVSSDDLILKPEFFPTGEDKNIAGNLLKDFFVADKDKLICFAPCSKWFTKSIPELKSAEIISALFSEGYKVILTGGKEDEIFCESVVTRLQNEKMVINMAGKLTPVQSSIVIERADALITVDSAASHIGSATNTPIIIVYGSTIPGFGFYPLTSKNIIIENNSLDCRPCTDHGRGSCPKQHFKCMQDINIDELLNSLVSILGTN
ncbi:MAG: glycosyltransferase family 9 protein [Ignavibacteria bacterium]